MRRFLLVISVIVASGLVVTPALMQDMPSGSSPYDAVDSWLKPFASSGYSFGSTGSVFAESPDRIFIAQRGENKLPDPIPPGFRGFFGSIDEDAMNAIHGRVQRNTIFVVDGDGKRELGLGRLALDPLGVPLGLGLGSVHSDDLHIVFQELLCPLPVPGIIAYAVDSAVVHRSAG